MSKLLNDFESLRHEKAQAQSLICIKSEEIRRNLLQTVPNGPRLSAE